MLTFDEMRQIAAGHCGEPFARKGLEDDGFCVITPQSVVDDERIGLVLMGGAWIVVDRETGAVDEWPHLVYMDRVKQMRVVGT